MDTLDYGAFATHFQEQRTTDNVPCPKCGGDRLRVDYTGSSTCHAAFPAER